MDSTDAEVRDLYVTGLRNAHAMENQALSIMKPQVQRIENYPQVADLLNRHIGETEGQLRRLETALSELGEDNSTLKDWALSMAGGMAAIGHSMAGDEILKNAMANFAFEHYEIAAYKSLITLAEANGHASGLAALQANLDEEKAMAAAIEAGLRPLTLQFARRSEAGVTAKV
jgi:ferritin-like metal-binding protein YciE